MEQKVPMTKMRRQRVFTKETLLRGNWNFSKNDRELMIAAALKLGESRSQFLRIASRERAIKVLGKFTNA